MGLFDCFAAPPSQSSRGSGGYDASTAQLEAQKQALEGQLADLQQKLQQQAADVRKQDEARRQADEARNQAEEARRQAEEARNQAEEAAAAELEHLRLKLEALEAESNKPPTQATADGTASKLLLQEVGLCNKCLPALLTCTGICHKVCACDGQQDRSLPRLPLPTAPGTS